MFLSQFLQLTPNLATQEFEVSDDTQITCDINVAMVLAQRSLDLII